MKIKSFLPGISIAILISLVAWYLGILFPIIGGPVIGLFIGLLFGSLITDSEKLKTGIQFTSKKSITIRCYSSRVWAKPFSSFQSWLNLTSYHFSHYCYGTRYCLLHPKAI